ncbi:MAG: protein-methionine-sulfoxide reductase catalytic subunit MsrP [bacterium]
MLIKSPKGWEMRESLATPESIYVNRRDFLKKMGFTGLGVWGLLAGCYGNSSGSQDGPKNVRETIPAPGGIYPVDRNAKYAVDRPLTAEEVAASYNNFYEFTATKEDVWKMAWRLQAEPWKVEVGGEVHKPKTFDVDELRKMTPMQERVYRFRCVEAWSMTVPWVGFPFKALIDHVQPTSKAKYIRMLTFLDKKQAPGQKQSRYPWPYYEGLSMAEATNELTMLVTGIYGHALPKQHGAPIRLITPWKYGFKSIKSIVRIEFVEKQPPTFWNTLTPAEYDFNANVDPQAPHPRWSQATERVIPSGERVPTQMYNGYGEYVAHLYG